MTKINKYKRKEMHTIMYKIGDRVRVLPSSGLTEDLDKVYSVTNVLLEFVEISDGVSKKVIHESKVALVK